MQQLWATTLHRTGIRLCGIFWVWLLWNDGPDNWVLDGPAYARRCADAAAAAGAEVRAGSTVTGWTGPHVVTVTSARGVETVEATAVLLATGCRERPRTARLVPGDRPP